MDIHIFIGTKAQYIKTAPLMRLLQQRNIPYRLIDSGQHAKTTAELRQELGVKKPDVVLHQKGNIRSVTVLVGWFLEYLFLAVFRPKKVSGEIFGGKGGVCVIHGDTLSTLVGLLLARRAGLRVAHIEAGLRSFNPLKPFPEEIVRIICMHAGHYLFAPNRWALQNIRRMNIRGAKVFNIHQNTNVEALYYSLKKGKRTEEAGTDYCVMIIHRAETILIKKRLEFIVAVMEHIAHQIPVRFVMHDPTRNKLAEFGFLERLMRNPKIRTSGLLPHSDFLRLVSEAAFLITDGGSIQEESHYLNVPCLVMRSETERNEGLGSNVRLACFSWDEVTAFLRDYPTLRRSGKVADKEPSKKILEVLGRNKGG